MGTNADIVTTIAAAAAAATGSPVVCSLQILMDGCAVFSECNLKVASVSHSLKPFKRNKMCVILQQLHWRGAKMLF